MAGFHAKKSLGQNFISDPGIISAIADASCAGPLDTVVEIGPGLGALTCELAERAAKVYAVELDTSVIPLLKGNLAGAKNVEVINEDILKFDWSRIPAGSTECSDAAHISGSPGQVLQDRAECSGAAACSTAKSTEGTGGVAENNSPRSLEGTLRIVGNLPYYITTPILLGILEKGVPAKSITVMVQKEVAQRICAAPGGRDYGVLSVSLQYYADCSCVLDVPSEFFTPRPKVDSAVVHMILKKDRLLAPMEEPQFFALVKAAFSQRRKTLLNSLTGFRPGSAARGEGPSSGAAYSGKDRAVKTGPAKKSSGAPSCAPLAKEQVLALLNAADIDPGRRPETLSIEEFAHLSRTLNCSDPA